MYLPPLTILSTLLLDVFDLFQTLNLSQCIDVDLIIFSLGSMHMLVDIIALTFIAMK